MPASDHILIVDDDSEIRTLLSEYFVKNGFRASAVADGRAMRAALRTAHPDLVILDLMLPGEDGLALCRELRARSNVPILMLTARGEETDRIVGLEMGADDYLPKPFNPRELVARVRAIHRRAAVATAGPEPGSALVVDDLTLAPAARRVLVRGEEVKLTTAEYDLLDILIRSAGAVVSREDLTRAVLGRRLSAFDRAIDMHVSNLRKKLGPSRSGGDRIKTVRNAGYILAREGQ